MSSFGFEPFPWQGVPDLKRAEQDTASELRRRASASMSAEQVQASLGGWLSDDVQVCWGQWRRGQLRGPVACRVELEFAELGLRLVVEPDVELLRLSVARLLRQPFELGRPEVELDAAVRGAGAALVLEVARRAARREVPSLAVGTEVWSREGWLRRAQVRIEGRSLPLEIQWSALSDPLPPVPLPTRQSELRRLGPVVLSLPWVVAVSQSDAKTLASLAPGDVWLPGADCFLSSGLAHAAPEIELNGLAGSLAAPNAAWGWPVFVTASGLKLGPRATELPRIQEERGSRTMDNKQLGLEKIVGEAPVLVRLEVGSVEMTAAEWSQLEVGDVLDSGCRSDSGVVLRVGGQVVARGELVRVEGSIGVRIVEVAGAESGPK